MKNYEDEVVVCAKCNKKFIKRMIHYPCNTEPARNSYYWCPYCKATYDIRLSPFEDVTSLKMNKEE